MKRIAVTTKSNHGDYPRDYWKSMRNQRTFFDEAAKKLGIKSHKDWYNVKFSDIQNLGGFSLMNEYYGNSLAKALPNVYPENEWHIWRFHRSPRGFWKDPENVKSFCDAASSELKITSHEQWYKIHGLELAKLGGGGLLAEYKGSLPKILSIAYPSIDWKLWRFAQVPKRLWNDEKNVVAYLNWISDQLGIVQKDDWKNVSAQQLNQSLLVKYGGIQNLISKYFPGVELKTERKDGSLSKAQHRLTQVLKTLFPAQEILTNYAHPKLLFPLTNREMELDVYIPSLNMAFEYQGEQHFAENPLFGPSDVVRQRDKHKMEACRQNNITLIEIPFWWNRNASSVLATILKARPDVASIAKNPQPTLLDSPIPEQPPRTRKRRTLPGNRSDKLLPYRVTIGKTTGGYPKCRSCYTVIKDRTSLRFEIKATFTAVSDSNPLPITLTTCLNKKCFDGAMERFQAKTGSGVFFPSFDKKFGIPKDLASQIPSQLMEEFQGAEWIPV